jgi:hypothetical protein
LRATLVLKNIARRIDGGTKLKNEGIRDVPYSKWFLTMVFATPGARRSIAYRYLIISA